MAISQALLGPTGQPLDLVRGGQLAPWCRLQTSRAQVSGVQSSAIAANGSSVVFYGADTPRFDGSAQRLLIEGQRTNRVMQPIAVASATGAWVQFGGTATPTITRNYSIAPDGTQTAARVRWVGPNGTGPLGSATTVRIPTSGVAISTSCIVSFWIYARSIGDATSAALDVMDGTGSANFLPQVQVGSWRRVISSVVTSSPNAGSQWVDVVFTGFTTGEIDFDFWGVQVEEASFASSLTIPPAATPGASTRGTDNMTVPLSSIGVPDTGKSTIIWRGTLAQFVHNARIFGLGYSSPAVAFGSKLESVDFGFGSPLNLIRLENGVAVGGDWGPSINVPIRIGASIDPNNGNVHYEVRGDTITGAKITTPFAASGLTTLRLGIDSGVSNPMWGSTSNLRVYPNLTVTPEKLSQLIMELPL